MESELKIPMSANQEAEQCLACVCNNARVAVDLTHTCASSSPPAAELDLEAIEGRVAKTTPGPWDAVLQETSLGTKVGLYIKGLPSYQVCGDGVKGMFASDAEFIAHARTDIPALLAEVRRLKSENERLSEAVTLQQVEVK